MIVVFLGPTLSLETARQTLDAVYLPPVAQGDVYRVALRRPRAIGIVDGYFQQVRSVWHKEILWAMHEGIPVYGAASMGALRAAELADFGMRGVGRIFDDFYHDRLEDDDEVAIVHGPPDSGYRALSEAMVNIRSTLERALAEGMISEADRQALVSVGRSIFYPDRSWPRLLDSAAGQVADETLRALRTWVPSHRVDQKAADAVALLERLRDDVHVGHAPDFHFEHTHLFETHMRRQSGVIASTLDGTMLPTDLLVEELRLRGVPYLAVSDRALVRESVAQAARASGRTPDPEQVARFERRFRAAHDLTDDDRLHAWLAHNDLTVEQFAALLHEEALVAAHRATLDSGGLLRQLRLEDEYGDLRARAEEKERRLQERGLPRPQPADLGVTADTVVDWYFARLGRPRPADLAAYARTFGFTDDTALLRALAREYAFVTGGA